MKPLLSFLLGAIVVASVGTAIYFAAEQHDANTVTSIGDGISDVAKSMDE